MIDSNADDRARSGPTGVPPAPSLGEIYDISARRQRTRYRLVQGTLVATAVVGIGIGINDGGDPTAESVLPATEAETGETTPEPETGTAGPDPRESDAENDAENGSSGLPDPPACLFTPQEDPAASFSPWIEDGRVAYFEDPTITALEIEDLAAAWQVPFDETKALVGLAARHGLDLQPDTNDTAFDAWYAEGFTSEQLAGIAEEWNVTTTSVKVLNLMGASDIDVALAACGLSA